MPIWVVLQSCVLKVTSAAKIQNGRPFFFLFLPLLSLQAGMGIVCTNAISMAMKLTVEEEKNCPWRKENKEAPVLVPH